MRSFHPLVSVIIPCFNVENYIEECIASVIEQSYSNLEIICVDNNSTDHTLKKLQELKEKHPQIIIGQELKKGAPAARNKGLENAKGEWIQFLDADDLLLPDKIINNIELIQASNNPFLVVGTSKRIMLDGSTKIDEPETNDLWLGLFMSKLGITSANLFKKSEIVKVGGWNETLNSSQEYTLMFELMKSANEVVFDKNVSTLVRDRESGSITKATPDDNYIRYTVLRCSIINYLKSNKEAYFKNNRRYYYNNIYERIRVVAFHSKALSKKLYKETLPARFVPDESRFSGKGFLLVNRYIGYSTALRFEKILNKLF